MKIAIASGGFDPIHSGHISYLKNSALKGDKLIVCLNSDKWLTAKKGKPFMPFTERKIILESLHFVNEVVQFDDSDGSCINGIHLIKEKYPRAKIIFCNGGDRNTDNIPESQIRGISFEFEVGGNDKINSSSNILKSWNENFEERSWGSFSTLLTEKNLKVKELVVLPLKGMSFQRHHHRKEIWYVHSGSCTVFLDQEDSNNLQKLELCTGDVLEIPVFAKHQIINSTNATCRIIEIQAGAEVNENDIERFFYYPDTPETV